MSDEQAIRDLIAEWMRARKAGDWRAVSRLMTEDLVFLVAGQPPMKGREAFGAGFQAMQGKVQIDGKSETQEIQVSGNLAYCWTKLAVTITPLAGGEAKRRSGYTLSVFRKEPQGNWVLARDANLLTVEGQPSAQKQRGRSLTLERSQAGAWERE
jgi:uncharacterized protein (TIGR02246 family)